MPWTTLGLNPAEATERDVKRAYAKRLKTCRPDQDPEGFRKLHDAYQAALYELQWRSAEDGGVISFQRSDSSSLVEMPEVGAPDEGLRQEAVTHTDASPENDTTAHELPGADLSPGLRAITESFDRLESAFDEGADGIGELIGQTETLLYQHPSEVFRWGDLMYEIFSRHGEHPDLRLKADTIVFELEHGGNAATLAVMDRLDRKGSPQAIANLANLLLQNKARIATPAGGIAAARLAGAAAFWVNRHAEGLADFAYQHLARGERDFHMQLIDRHAAMAQIMTPVPDHLKSFCRQCMMRTGGRDAWESEQGKATIEWLKTTPAKRALCYEALVGLLPDEIAESVKASPEKWQPYESSWTTSSRAGDAAPPVRRSGARPAPSSTSSRNLPEWEQGEARPRKAKKEYHSSPRSGFGSSSWLWVFLVITSLRALVTCANSSSYSSPPPPRLNLPSSLEQFDPETQRRVKEGAEKFRELREKREQSKEAIPSAPSIVPPPKLTIDPKTPETPENPLLKQFESGTR